jgi:hypothetical protein
MTRHHQPLVFQLLGDIAGCGARHFDPGLAEDRARDHDEGDVHNGVDGIEEGVGKVQRWGHVVRDTGGSEELAGAFTGFPDANELHEQVIAEAAVEHLADYEDVGGQCRLQHDGHVGGVEEADGVGAAHAALTGGFYGDFHAEALQVDDGGEDGKGREEVHDVGEVLAVEGFAEGALFVGPGEEKMEESDDCAFEFGAAACVDGSRGERFPDDGFADVGRDKEGDAAAKAVAFLEKLIEEDDDEAGEDELHDEEEADSRAEIAGLAVETGEDEDASLAEGENDREELLRGLVELAVGLEVEVDIDEVGTGKKLGILSVPINISFLEALHHTWKTIPDEMIGVVPSSIRVPLLLAIIILSQYSGSEVSEETIPNSGIWLMTKKMSRVNYSPRQNLLLHL